MKFMSECATKRGGLRRMNSIPVSVVPKGEAAHSAILKAMGGQNSIMGAMGAAQRF